MASETNDLISTMRNVDNKIGNIPQQYTLNSGPDEPAGIANVPKSANPAIVEKTQYAPMLVPGKNLTTTIPVTDEDVAAIKKKAYIATLRDFDNWITKTFLAPAGGIVNNPAVKDWLLSVYPAWFDRQQEAMEKIIDTNAKYQKMLIDGAQSLEDIYFMFWYEQHIEDLSHIEWAIKGYVPTASGQLGADPVKYGHTSFERGLFNFQKAVQQQKVLGKGMGHYTSAANSVGPYKHVDKNFGKNQSSTAFGGAYAGTENSMRVSDDYLKTSAYNREFQFGKFVSKMPLGYTWGRGDYGTEYIEEDQPTGTA